MKYLLCLVILATVVGCVSASKPKPYVRTEGEIRYCVEACMLYRVHPIMQDRADIMGQCELECR